MSEYIFNNEQKGATAFTAAKNRETAKRLHLDPQHCVNDQTDLAKAHCIAPAAPMHLRNPEGKTVWNTNAYYFYQADAVPDTVNPSLWAYGKSYRPAGVFEIVPGAIYQARGYELANLTIIRSKHGWIAQDACTTEETASAALQALENALGEPVKEKIRAVIISHSHFDHYGGIKALVSEEQVGQARYGLIPIYAPADFDVECVRENVFAGPAMRRRAMHQFGGALEAGPRGSVSTASATNGTSGFIMPTDYITEDGPKVIDGITVEFQLTPETEAVANMNNYYADYRALWMADNCPNSLHNLYPIRGAQIRDGAAWTDYLLEAAERFGSRSDVVFGGHSWAHYNTPDAPYTVRDFLLGTAAVYKYIHDQTLLYANKGLTAKEIAQKIDDIPEGLAGNWYTRPYYGTPQINARAVFHKYLGFYNGSPTDLDALTEKEEAVLFVRYAGGADAVLAQAVRDFENGDYRAAANAAAKASLADPDNEKARQLTADAYEQLGYTAESGIWRNAYLQEARELRGATHVRTQGGYERQHELDICMPTDLVLAYLGILLDYDRLQEEHFSFALTVTDGNGRIDDSEPLTYNVTVYAGILLPVRTENPSAGDYVKLPRKALFAWADGELDSVRDLIETNIYEKLLRLQDALADFSAAE